MTKRYINPPLIEALCEFQFDQDSPWDLTLLGLIYEKLKETFPRRQQLQLSLNIAPQEMIEQVIATPMIPLVRFLDVDGKALVQIGQNLLTVNHLKPYPSWQEFLPLIEFGFRAYCEVTDAKRLRHIGIRYINRIEIQGQNINLDRYLKFRPYVTSDLPSNLDGFYMGVSIPYEDSKDMLRIQLTTTNAEAPDTTALVLEIAYVFSKPGEIPLDYVIDKVNKAHDHIERAFESCITDELRESFGEVKE